MSAVGTAVLDRPRAFGPEPEAAWTSVADVVGVPFPLAPRPVRVQPARARSVASTRHRTLTVLMWAAALAAGWLLYRQMSQVDLGPVVASARWSWVVVAVGFFGVSLAGASLNLIGTSPVHIGFPRTYVVQVACGFVKLISPSAVGGAALNARYVHQAGVSTPVAVASVGTAQVIQVGSTLAMLAVLGPLTGTVAMPDIAGSPGLFVLAGTAVVVVGLAGAGVASLPRLRHRLAEVVGSIVVQARVSDLTARTAARRMLLAVGGSLLLTAGLVLSLTASVAAMGGVIAPVTIGMAFLLGSAVGSLVPTPGGIGTVEAALVAALVASGQSVAVALPAVLIFRAVTVWLPVPVGWVAFDLLRRRGHV